MDQLVIEAGSQTPRIEFDGNLGVFKIKGKSYPENVNIFYTQVLDYIDEYKRNPQPKTRLEFNWLYYNTATNKMIIRIIMGLNSADTTLETYWYYNEDFEMIREKGEEIKNILGFDLKVEPV